MHNLWNVCKFDSDQKDNTPWCTHINHSLCTTKFLFAADIAAIYTQVRYFSLNGACTSFAICFVCCWIMWTWHAGAACAAAFLLRVRLACLLSLSLSHSFSLHLYFLINTLHFTSKMIYVALSLFACLSYSNTNYRIRNFSWKQNGFAIPVWNYCNLFSRNWEKQLRPHSFHLYTTSPVDNLIRLYSFNKTKTMIHQSNIANFKNCSNY